jgi:VanZ family protein
MLMGINSEEMEDEIAMSWRWGLGVLGIASVLMLIYASLIPLQYRALSWHDSWQRWKSIPWLNLGVTNRADWIANGLAVIPCSFLLLGALNYSKRGIGGIKPWVPSVLGGLFLIFLLIVLVVCIELAQVWFPPRTVSWNDVVSGWLGIFLGAIGWIVFGEISVDAVRKFLGIESLDDRFNAFAWFAALVIFVYSTYPFDFVLSFKEWNEKLDLGRVRWGLDTQWISSREGLQGLFFSTIRMIPFGIVGMSWKSKRLRWVWMVLVPVILELVQLPIFSKYSSLWDVVAGWIGGVFGFWFFRPNRFWIWIQSLRWLWAAAIVIWSGLLLAVFLGRWEKWVEDPEHLTQRWSGFLIYPLLRYYYGSEYSAVTNLGGKLLSFSVLGCLFASHWIFGKNSSSRFACLVLVAVLLGLVIEVSQIYLEPLVGDINDIWVYVLGALLGAWSTLYLFRGQNAFGNADGDPIPDKAFAQVVDLNEGFIRNWVGLAFGSLAVGLALIHPGWPLLQVGMALSVLGIVYLYPYIYPLFYVLLLVGGDAYPLTGQLALQEYDSLLAGATCGLMFAAKKFTKFGESIDGGLKIDRLMVVGLGLLFISTLVSSIVGWIRLPSAPWGDQLSVYFTQWNVFRISKGILWGVVFAIGSVWVLRGVGRTGRRQWQLTFLRGFNLAGLYVGSVVLVERWMFPGLWNWKYVYRATGPFFTMHVGDHHIDIFLAIAFPMVWANLWYPNVKKKERWLCSLVLIFILHTAFATMSRATLCVLLLEACLLVCLTWSTRNFGGTQAIARGAGRSTAVFWISGIMGLTLIAGLVGAIFTQAMQSRFATTSEDWSGRTSHWRMILSRGTTGLGGVCIGHGIGTLPSLIASEWSRSFPPIQWLSDSRSESPQGLIRIDGGWPIYVERLVWKNDPALKELIAMRVKRDQTEGGGSDAREPSHLVATLVDKSVLESFDGKTIASVQVESQWTNLDLSVLEKLDWEKTFDPRRPKSFGFHVPGQGVVLLGGTSGSSISTAGSYPWFFTCDEHLAWRALNFPVHAYYEQGLAGVIAWTVLLVGGLSRGFRRWMFVMRSPCSQRPFPMASYQLICLLGFVGIGFVGSLIDTPWIIALFLGILSMESPSTLREPQ